MYQESVDDLLAQYQRHRENLADARRALEEITCTATAPRRVVSVTVDQQGAVTDIRFPTTAYKTMTKGDLSAALLATIGEARAEAMRRASEVMAPLMPPWLPKMDFSSGSFELDAVLPADPGDKADITGKRHV